ncbi:MAG: hypothetical protein JO112_07080 [Planctomycetes bacterium]|nr:hypothetical protein [Planctomycetota bacterium]
MPLPVDFRCPVCRARVEGPQCRRCRADLSLLFQLEEQRDRTLASGYQLLQQGQPDQALIDAEQADAFRRDQDARRLQALCHLVQRHFAAAWRAYKECQKEEG